MEVKERKCMDPDHLLGCILAKIRTRECSPQRIHVSAGRRGCKWHQKQRSVEVRRWVVVGASAQECALRGTGCVCCHIVQGVHFPNRRQWLRHPQWHLEIRRWYKMGISERKCIISRQGRPLYGCLQRQLIHHWRFGKLRSVEWYIEVKWWQDLDHCQYNQ